MPLEFLYLKGRNLHLDLLQHNLEVLQEFKVLWENKVVTINIINI